MYDLNNIQIQVLYELMEYNSVCEIIQEMYTLQEIIENPMPPEMKGYAHIVLNSKFREKYLQLSEGRLLVFEGEFTQRPLQKMDLTGRCHLQLIDDKSIGLEFTCKSDQFNQIHSILL